MSDRKFETIKKAVSMEGKDIGGFNVRARFAVLWINLEPIGRGNGIQFKRIANEDRLPPSYFNAIERGVRRALQRDGQEGFPVTDVRCSIDGCYHPVDSKNADYDGLAFRTTVDALRKAGTKAVE